MARFLRVLLVVLAGALALLLSQCIVNDSYGITVSGEYEVLGGETRLGRVHPSQLFRDGQGRCWSWVGTVLHAEDFAERRPLPPGTSGPYASSRPATRPVVDGAGKLWVLRHGAGALRLEAPEGGEAVASLPAPEAPVHAELRGDTLWVVFPDRVVRLDRRAPSAPVVVVEGLAPAIQRAAISPGGALALGHEGHVTLVRPDGTRRELRPPGKQDGVLGLCFLGEQALVVATGYGAAWEASRLRVLDPWAATPTWRGEVRLPYVWDLGSFPLAPSMVPGPDGTVMLLCAQDMENAGSAALLRIHPDALR